jgi:hypothetical protein
VRFRCTTKETPSNSSLFKNTPFLPS